MKKRLAILLLFVFVLFCAVTALSAGAATYVDEVDLLPKTVDVIRQNSSEQNGIVEFALVEGGLSLTRAAESQIYWPSIRYDVQEEIDLSKTPYLHLTFTCSAEGENLGRGINGHVFYTVDGGEEQDGWFSQIAGREADDFRGSADMYYDFTKVANTTGKITVTSVVLSIYGDAGETVVWNAIAFASDSESGDEPAPGDTSSEASAEEPEETSSEASAEESAEASSVDSGVSSEAPAETSGAASEASDDAAPASDGIGTLGIVLIVVGCVAVVAVVAIVIVKKKK